MPNLNPVILRVPDELRRLKGRDGHAALSRLARQAAVASALKTGVHLSIEELVNAEDGSPLPVRGWFWSISHKPRFVGGVIGDNPVGLDIETILFVTHGLYRKTASPEEWALCEGKDRLSSFFRYWTAKEAVLKTSGAGVKDLLRCRVREIPNSRHLVLEYAGRKWRVEHAFFDGHVAGVTVDGVDVEWELPV